MFVVLVLFAASRNAAESGPALTPPLGLTLRNESGQAWVSKPITSGVALPRGAVNSTATLALAESGGPLVPAQYLRTARWPEGSFKWVLIDFQASLGAGSSRRYELRTGIPAPVPATLSVSESPTALTVRSGSRTAVFNRTEFKVLGREFQVVKGATTYRATPFAGPVADAFPSPALPWKVEENGPLKIVLRSEGSFRAVTNPAQEVAPYIRYRARLYFYANQPTVTAFVTLKNNQSYMWESPTHPADQNFSAIRLGGLTLTPTATNLFGPGLEKTWQVVLNTSDGSARQVVVQVDPAHPANTFRAEPLLLPDPGDVDRIGGFGEMVPPLVTNDPTSNAILNRFEKTQLAEVSPAAVERLADGSMGNNVFDHMAPQLGNYKDYGDLSWAEGWSRNHYDWVYGMDLHWLRTGESRFLDAATIFARHGADLDIYHTWRDGAYFNFMCQWEGAGGGNDGTHNNPGNGFGPGRPSHTWNQGLMLHWLLTGDRRCCDAAYETIEGARQFLYLGAGGYVPDREIRIQGWLSELFMTAWLVDPFGTLNTGAVGSGTTTTREAVLGALQPILDLERADGGRGFVLTDAGGTEFSPLLMHYPLEPLIKAYDRLLRSTGDPRAAPYRDLIVRMTDTLRRRYVFGDANAQGYRPLQIHTPQPIAPPPSPPLLDNECTWLLMAANAAAYVYGLRGDAASRDFARKAFRDFVYYRETGSAERTDPASRVPTSYRSLFYTDTESKVHGWTGRYGQYYLRMERQLGARLAGERPTPVGQWTPYR